MGMKACLRRDITEMTDSRHNIPLQSPSDPASSEQTDIFAGNRFLRELFDGMPQHVMLLNSSRQIIYANSALKAFAHSNNTQIITGIRPGELLACDHSLSAEHGCGTADSCATCGALSSILAALDGEQACNECRIIRKRDNRVTAIDFRVWAAPITIGNEQCVLVVSTDITNEKKLHLLERMFLHDIKNTALSINYLTTLLLDDCVPYEEVKSSLLRASRLMLNEISHKQLLYDAEYDLLQVSIGSISPAELLDDVASAYYRQAHTKNVRIVIESCQRHSTINNDSVLLSRVIENMLKNALESSPGGCVVSLRYHIDDEAIFECHNENVIPHEDQANIFSHTFSTKGVGRGLGSYSIKLITERYLGGRVSFSSSPGNGTLFRLTLPLDLNASLQDKDIFKT